MANAPAPVVSAYGPADVARRLEAFLASDEGRVHKAFDRALALDRSRAYRPAGQDGKPDIAESYGDEVADDLEVGEEALKSGMSAGMDMLRGQSDVRHDPNSAHQAVRADGLAGSLGGVGIDVLDEVLGSLGSLMMSVVVDGVVARNVRALYWDFLTRLPAIIHPEVSFGSGACWLIAIKDWRVAVVLPGNRDKVRGMPPAAKMRAADALSWAGQLRDRPGLRLTKTQDKMLAVLGEGGSDADTSPLAVVVSPPWPPGKMKVRMEREFRGWRYRAASDRVALVTWKPPVYNGGLGGTSFRVLTYPPPGDRVDSDPDRAAVNMPQLPARLSGYENVNSVRIAGLAHETQYRFAVVAANALGYSDRAEAALTGKKSLYRIGYLKIQPQFAR